MSLNLDQQMRQRNHVKKMLARAERRSRQAARLVDKWKLRLMELDRAGVAEKQTKLWADDQQGSDGGADRPGGA